MLRGLSWKTDKTKRSYLKERAQQHQQMKEEASRLDMLLKEEVIDKETYKRLKKLLEISYQKKRQETRLKYGFL